MENGYWDRVLLRRVSRRRALAGAGGAAAAAAFLAACGGGDSEDEPQSAASRDTSGLLSDIVDSSKQAKTGGKYVYPARREPCTSMARRRGRSS